VPAGRALAGKTVGETVAVVAGAGVVPVGPGPQLLIRQRDTHAGRTTPRVSRRAQREDR